MSKRFLYRYKIVRLYEEDIWGIFFRKQKKRDLFFKKIGYQLFLEIFRKNSYLVNSTVLAWKKKLLYLGRQHTKKNVKCQYQLALNLKKKSKFFLVNKQTIYFKNSLKHFSLFLKDFFFVNRTYFFNETKKCLTISFLLLATVPKKISQKSLNKYVLYLKKALAFILLRYVFNDLEVFTKYVSQIVNTNFKFLYNFNYKYTDIVKWYNNLYYIRFIKTLHNIESSWASSPLYHNNVLHANTLSLYLKNMRLNLYFKVFQLKEQISAWRYREESQLSKIFQPFFFRDTLLANRYQHSMWLPLWWYWRILQKKKKRKARYLRSRQFVKSFKHHNYKTNQRYKKSNHYKKPYKPYYKKPYKPYYKKSDNQQYSNSNNNKQQPHYYKPYHNNNKPYRKPYNNSYHKPYNNAETENKPYHQSNNKPYNNSYRKSYNNAETGNKPYNNSHRKPYNNAETENKPYNNSYRKPYNNSYRKPYNNAETENKPYHNNNNKFYYTPKPQFNNKNNQNNKQPQAYKSQAQAHNKQSHKHAFKYKYKQPFKKAYNKRGAHYKYVHKRKQPILRIKRIRPQIKYFSLLSWYNWRVKNKKKFFRLKIKFAVFLHKWNLHKRENQLDLADLNIFKAKKKKYMFRYFLARKLLREPDSVYLNHIKGKRNLLIAKKSKIKAAVVKKPKTKVAVAKKAKTIVSLGKKLKTKVSVAKKSKAKVSVVKKPKTKVSSAKKSKTKVAVVKKPKTKVAVAKKAKTKVAVAKKAKTRVTVAKKPKTKESLVKEPKTSVAVVKKSKNSVVVAKNPKTKVSSAKKAKTKKIVAKPKKNSKMISLTRTSSILNKNTIPTTQKRFYTTETNIGYYKQNNAKPTFDQRRIWKPKNNNYKSNVTGKEKNFSGNFRKNKNVNYQRKEQIFIIGDNNTSGRRPKVKKKYFLNKKKKPNLKLKQFTRKRKSYKPLLKIQKKPLYPKVWKLEMLEFTMWGVAKPGGHFGGYIMPTKKKKKILNKKAGTKLFFWKTMQKLSGQFFLSCYKKRNKYLSKVSAENFKGYNKIYHNWSMIKSYARKKYLVSSVKKKFRPKRYSSLLWHFCLLFKKDKDNKIFSTFKYKWSRHKFFSFLKNFSFKSKFNILLHLIFRYKYSSALAISTKLKFSNVFFVRKLSNKYFRVNKFTIGSWLCIIEKKISYNFNYNMFLNLYITYIMSKTYEAKYYSLLPFVRNVLTCYNTLLYANNYNILNDNTNIFEPTKSSFTLFNFIKSRVLHKYKIYFYLFYTFWYIFNGNMVYFKYLKYLKLCQDSKNFQISYANIKNLYVNKIFLHFNTTFFKNNNINILTFFKLTSVKFIDCLFFFNAWFLNYIVMLYDNIISVRKFKLYANIKKSKQKFLSNTKNEYMLLKKLLELFCLKKKSEALSKYNLFFKKWIHTVAYAQKKIRRLLYSVRIFFYQKYNKVPESDSIFNVTAEDLINAVKKKNPAHAGTGNFKNNRRGNFPLKDFMKLFLKNKGLKQRKKLELKEFYCNDSIQFKKTEYLLSFFASNQMFKYFNKLRRKYLSFFAKKRQLFLRKINKNITLVSEYNPIFKFSLLKKYSVFLFRKILQIKKRIKFFSLRKRKTLLDKMFTLDLIPVVKYVKKKTSFNSFYKYRMLKIWKFRKFYGCLTNYELNSICLKAYKYRGDIILRFIILLEGRLDTVLYRCGLVTSMFEARQLINHGNFLINNVLVKKRSYVLQVKDILSIDPSKITLFKDKLLLRLQQDGLLFWPPVYLEVNYKYILVMFIHELLQINQIPFNFKLTGKDLNSILYYYY